MLTTAENPILSIRRQNFSLVKIERIIMRLRWGIIFFDMAENIVEKGENAGYQQNVFKRHLPRVSQNTG